MAAITSSNVTIIEAWDVGTKSGQKRAVAVRCYATLSTQGATALDLPASAFGMSLIFEATGGTLDASGTYTAYALGVPPANTSVFPASYVDGSPINLTGNLYMTLTGQTALS